VSFGFMPARGRSGVVVSGLYERITPNERVGWMTRQTRQLVAGIGGGFGMGLLVGSWLGGLNLAVTMLIGSVLVWIASWVAGTARRDGVKPEPTPKGPNKPGV
jgi:hypothetical protein